MERGRRVARGKFCSLYGTQLGWGGVVASTVGLLEVFTPFAGDSREKVAERIADCYPLALTASPLTEKAADLLSRYFAGDAVSFGLPVDFTDFTPFQKTVSEAVAGLPYGVVESYGEIAARAGNPAAARGVGGVMARNPLPVVIPCHRVVGGGGKMTGYSAPGGVESKKWLLVMEGVALQHGGSVACGKKRRATSQL